MKRTFLFRVVTGVLLASMLVIPLGVVLSSVQKQSAIIAEVESMLEDSEGDWMVTITLTNRSRRSFLLRGNLADFLLHEIKSGEESVRYPPELDEHQTNHVLLNSTDALTTQVSVPARMAGQSVRVVFHIEQQSYPPSDSVWGKVGKWWDTYRWGKITMNQVIETASFIPGS